jgi:hypothetical protein
MTRRRSLTANYRIGDVEAQRCVAGDISQRQGVFNPHVQPVAM